MDGQPPPATDGPAPNPMPALEWRGQSFPSTPPVKRPSALRPLVCSVLTGFLLLLSYFNDFLPVAFCWLGWVALVPLLSVVRMEISAWRVFWCAFAGGLVFFVPALQWLRVADPMMYYTWAALALYCTFFLPLGLLFVRRLDRYTRLPILVTVPAVWTCLEFFRAHFLTGFPWYFLGHTQHELLPVIQIADLGGAYAVTFLVAAVNGWLFELLARRLWFRKLVRLERRRTYSRRGALLQHAVMLLVLGGTLTYGYWRLGQDDFTPGPRVALLQGNQPQRIRNEAFSSDEAAEAASKDMATHYLALARQARDRRSELVVWPETSWPQYWTETIANQPDAFSEGLAKDFAHYCRSNVLVGMNAQVGPEGGPTQRFNAAVLMRKDGVPAGRYDKIHLVPFGEYLPFRYLFPWMKVFAPYPYDYSITSGERMTRFPLERKYLFGVLICFEDTDPVLARQYVLPPNKAPQADFLLNISNDGWFDGTSEHEEHLAICRFRAIETRRAIARAVNMGVSAIIDGNGRVLTPHAVDVPAGSPPVWEVSLDEGARSFPETRWKELKKVAGVLMGAVPIDHRASFYAEWGDWLPWGCWAGVGLGLFWTMAQQARFGKRAVRG
jgi:apolipoprotein N-acyltransferase